MQEILKNVYEQITLGRDYNICLMQSKEYISNVFISAADVTQLQKVKNQILPIIKDYLANLKEELNMEFRKNKSTVINELKQYVFEVYKLQLSKLESPIKPINKEGIYLPANRKLGELHPITITIHKIYNIMYKFGFEWRNAREIDDCSNIFDKLNMDLLHPAREDQQSFFLKGTAKIPRTHCTNFQSKILEEWNEKDELKYFHFGDVYRCDSDATHTPKFKQFEVFFLHDQMANLPTLMGFIDSFFEAFFGYKVEKRVRTSYFPFTEISYEVDIYINNKWLEIGGCGMVHPNVFSANGKRCTSAWALGMGIERLTMIAGNYKDIRKFYQNDIRGY